MSEQDGFDGQIELLSFGLDVDGVDWGVNDDSSSFGGEKIAESAKITCFELVKFITVAFEFRGELGSSSIGVVHW